MSSISQGAILNMIRMNDNKSNPEYQPVLQVLNIKPVVGGTERYRIVISDGTHFCQGMLATQINHLARGDHGLKANDLVCAKDFMHNNVQGRHVIILLNLVKVSSNGMSRIGTPLDIEQAGAALTSQPPPAGMAQPLYNSTNGDGNNNAVPKPATSPGTNPYGSPGTNPYGRPSSQPQSHASHAPIVRSAATGSNITPISALNMYQNKWTIRARVTSKSDIRTWSNAKGEGSLFSVELLDQTMDIRATFFKEAVDKFYNMLQVGKVYTFTGGRLKVANMQYNTCKSNFEVTFDQNSEIHLDNDDGDISRQNYEFVKISDLESMEPTKNVDILAVVKSIGEPASLVSKKTGNELIKCDLVLVDDSQTEVTCTVWGDKARVAPQTFANTPVVAFRRARVSDYGGRSLSAGDSTEVNPDLPQAHALKQWWQTTGGAVAARSLSSSSGGGGAVASLTDRKDIRAIKEENLGYTNPDKPDWLSFKATINFLKSDKDGGAWYPACANAGEPCKNRFKVTQTTDGQWYCDKCQGTFPNCVRRWIFSGVVEDETSSTWVSFFNEQAETLLGGVTADSAYEKMNEEGGEDSDSYKSLFAKAVFTEWIFKCKVKSEQVNDETRVKTSVFSLHPVDYLKESRDLLAAIEKF